MSEVMLAAAKFAAATRWRVFPTINKKPPAGFKWQDEAAEHGRVGGLDWSQADGYGVLLPHGVVVVDLDTDGNGDLTVARQTLATLKPEAQEALRRTREGETGWAVKTRSGGLHLYCYAEGGLNRQVKVGPGVDLRLGGHGYVIGPGSPGYELTAGTINPNRLAIFPFGGWRSRGM